MSKMIKDFFKRNAISIIVFILIVVAFGFYIRQFSSYGISTNTANFGVFGDYIGGVIGTIIAVYGAYYVYKTYQHQEKQGIRQQFENTFFQLLSQQRDIIKNLNGKIGTQDYNGYEYIHALHEELKVPMDDPEILQLTGRNLRYKINDFYTELFREHTSQLGHYFRHIYHILKYIDKSGIEEETKKEYADFIQSQMTTDELYILALNGVSEYGWKKARPLIDKYSLLENIAIENDSQIFYVIKNFYTKTVIKQWLQVKENIVFIGGVHGSGKDYFADNLKDLCKSKVNKLTCSEVLEWKKDSKEVDDASENQRRLIFNLRDIIEDDKKYFLIGHYCLANKNKTIERIPIDTFRAINPQSLILIEETPEKIHERLFQRKNSDNWDKDFVELFLKEEKQYAETLRDELGVPLYIYNSSEYNKAKSDLQSFID